MANEISTEGKDNITNEFMAGFGIESTDTLDSEYLNAFLDNEASITGDPENVTPANNTTDGTTSPKPNTATPPDTKGKTKEQLAIEQAAQIEKDHLEKEQQLGAFMNEEEKLSSDTTPPSGTSTKQGNEPNEELAENLAIMSKEFYRLGLFSKDAEDEDEAIKDPDAFLEKVNVTFKKGAQQFLENYLSRYSPKNKELFFATYEKGVDPEKYLMQLNKIESYEKMDLTQESNQELVVTQALRNQGWEEEDIKEQITKLKSYSELEDNALKYQKGLVKFEKAHAKQLEAEAVQEQQRLAQLDEDYDNNLRTIYIEKLKEKDFDGLPITEKSVEKAYDFAYNKKWDLNGVQLTDFDRFILDLKKPENHAVKAKLSLLFAQDYDPNKPIKVDFSKIQKKAVSKESKSLFQELATKSKSTTKSNAYSNVTKSFFD